MSNLLERAIDCNDGEQAAKIIQDALGIESDDVETGRPAKKRASVCNHSPIMRARVHDRD